MTSYLEAQVRGIQAKDKEITSDLTKLAYEVHSTQRRARKGKEKPPASSSTRQDAEEKGYLHKLEQMRGTYEAAAAERIEIMKKNWQQEYCKLEDQHFQTIRSLEEEVHRLRKAVHIADTELSVVTQNFADLKNAHGLLKDQAPDMMMLKHAVEVKEAVVEGLEHKVTESEAQIFKLRKSLEDAIEAIQRQHRENTVLLRRLENQAPKDDSPRDERLELEKQIWNFGDLVGAPLDSDFSAVVSLIGDTLKTIPKDKQAVKSADELCAKLSKKISDLEAHAMQGSQSPSSEAELLSQVRSLQAENETLQRARSCAEEQHNTTEGDLLSQISTLKMENAALTSGQTVVSELQMKISSMEDSESQLLSQISALKVDVSPEDESLLGEQSATINELKVQLEAIEGTAAQQARNEASLVAKVTTLESTLEVLRARAAELEQSEMNLSSQVETLKVTNASLADDTSSERLTNADQLISDLTAKMDTMEAASARHDKREAELLSLVAEVEDERDSERAEKQQMTAEVDTVQIKLADESSRCASLEVSAKAAAGLEGQVRELESDRETLELQVSALQEENDALRQKMGQASDLTEERESLHAELQALKADTPTLAAQLAATATSTEEVTSACALVTQQYHKRLQQLHSVALMCKDLKEQCNGQSDGGCGSGGGGDHMVEELKRQNSSRIKVLKEQMGEINVQKNSFKREVDELRRENEALKKDLQVHGGVP